MEVSMKYSKEQRIDIGRQVYTHELSRMEASQKYEVSDSSLDVYVSLYKLASGIQTQNTRVAIRNKTDKTDRNEPKPREDTSETWDIETYRAMSKEELINELIRAKVNEARAKKGYEVRGDGTNKEFISLSRKNSKS
jgi:transposase